MPFLLAAVNFATSTAWAQETTAPTAEAPQDVAPAAAEQASPKTVFSGFVDASFAYSNVGGAHSAGFGLDQVELDIEKAWDKVSVRADIEAGANYNTGTGTDVSFSLEQGYLSYMPTETITLTLGRYLAPIGWEILDPTDIYQYTHAYVFLYGVPFALTGAKMTYASGGLLDIQLYGGNGFDDWYEVDMPKALGTRVGLTFGDHNLGLSALYNHKEVLIADVDATLAFGSAKIGLEGNYGVYTLTTSEKWLGALATLNYGINEWMGLTLRGDTFQDTATGARLGRGADEMLVRGTLSPGFVLADGAGMLVEYSAEYASKADSLDHLVAMEMTYKF